MKIQLMYRNWCSCVGQCGRSVHVHKMDVEECSRRMHMNVSKMNIVDVQLMFIKID